MKKSTTAKKVTVKTSKKPRIYLFGYTNIENKKYVAKRAKNFKSQSAYLNYLVDRDRTATMK